MVTAEQLFSLFCRIEMGKNGKKPTPVITQLFGDTLADAPSAMASGESALGKPESFSSYRHHGLLEPIGNTVKDWSGAEFVLEFGFEITSGLVCWLKVVGKRERERKVIKTF